MAKIVKSISFNDADPVEVELLQHLERYPNFSGYVKALIRADMYRKQQTQKTAQIDARRRGNTKLPGKAKRPADAKIRSENASF
jgi:hypothetical protein